MNKEKEIEVVLAHECSTCAKFKSGVCTEPRTDGSKTKPWYWCGFYEVNEDVGIPVPISV